MKTILAVLCCIIIPIFSFKEIKPKFCFNCKYFISDGDDGAFGKCSLFPKKEESSYFLVNGIVEDKAVEYHYCATARELDDKCGKEGKMHKRKYIKKVY